MLKIEENDRFLLRKKTFDSQEEKENSLFDFEVTLGLENS